jgi:hypothetical protein
MSQPQIQKKPVGVEKGQHRRADAGLIGGLRKGKLGRRLLSPQDYLTHVKAI